MAGLNFKTGGTGLASQTRGERGQPIASRPSTNIVDKYNLQGFPPRILILLNYISDLGDNFLRCRGFLPSETAHKQNISRLGDRYSKPHESPRSTPPEPYYLSRANRQKANSRLSKRSDPELATPAELHVRSTFEICARGERAGISDCGTAIILDLVDSITWLSGPAPLSRPFRRPSSNFDSAYGRFGEHG